MARPSNGAGEGHDDADSGGEWQTVKGHYARRQKRWVKKNPTSATPPIPPPPDPISVPVLRETRHLFRPPLDFMFTSPQDRLVKKARQELKTYNHSTFARYTNPLDISKLGGSWFDSTSQQTVRLFAVGRDGLMAKVPLFLSSSSPSADQEVMVLDGTDTLPLRDWIHALPEPADPNLIGATGYKLMYQWHKDRGLRQTLSDLPDDIRNTILLHMVGEVRHTNTRAQTSGCVIHRGHKSHRWLPVGDTRYRFGPPTVEPLDPGLLCLSKDIKETLQPIIRSWTIKSFQERDGLDYAFRYATPFFDTVTRLQLAFDDEDYLQFFQVNLPGLFVPDNSGYRNATILSSMPSLRYLELWFDAILAPLISNPWQHQGHWGGTHFDRLQIDGLDADRFPCRKVFVDWVMCFAYKYIRHIPSVNLTGYVKTSTRNKWLRILQDKFNRSSLNMEIEQRVEEIRRLPVSEFPPKCNCTVACLPMAIASVEGSRPVTSEWYEGWDKANREYEKRLKVVVEDYKFDFDDNLEASELDKVYTGTDRRLCYWDGLPPIPEGSEGVQG